MGPFIGSDIVCRILGWQFSLPPDIRFRLRADRFDIQQQGPDASLEDWAFVIFLDRSGRGDILAGNGAEDSIEKTRPDFRLGCSSHNIRRRPSLGCQFNTVHGRLDMRFILGLDLYAVRIALACHYLACRLGCSNFPDFAPLMLSQLCLIIIAIPASRASCL